MNVVNLIGRLTRDPEFVQVSEGKHTVAKFTLAIDRESKSSNTKKVDFINIEAWDDQAKVCEDNLYKGSLVSIKGAIRVETYENKEKIKKTITKVKAYNCTLLDQPYAIKEKYFNAGNVFDENNGEESEEVPF